MYTEKYDVKDITQVPNGAGYSFWRSAIEAIIDLIASATENIILCGHVKDSALAENASGSLKTLDLTGKKN